MKVGTVALLLAGTAVFSGCATVVGDTTQSIRVETLLADGTEVRGAECELVNKFGNFRVTTPGSVSVRRSAGDLRVTCRKDGEGEARGVSVSRTNPVMLGNIIIGGVVGSAIDHAGGAGYVYPQWVQVVMGKQLKFDQRDDGEGQPSVAREVYGGAPLIAGSAMKAMDRPAISPASPLMGGASGQFTVRLVTGKELRTHFSGLGTVSGVTDTGAEIRLNVKPDGHFDVRNLRSGGSAAGTYTVQDDGNQVCMVLKEHDWRIMGDCYHLFDMGGRKYAMRSVMNNYNFTYSTH
jgi:hypothetical protein